MSESDGEREVKVPEYAEEHVIKISYECCIPAVKCVKDITFNSSFVALVVLTVFTVIGLAMGLSIHCNC